MISLIGNELKKIFKKKTLIILFIIVLALCVLSNGLTKVFDKYVVIEDMFDEGYYEAELKFAKESGDIEYQKQCEAGLEAYKIIKKYGKDSWQRYVIEEKLQPLIFEMLKLEKGKEYEKLKKEYDEILANIEKGDWRLFAQSELKDINEQIKTVNDEESLELLKQEKQVVEWRLEKDIPYGKSNLNKYLLSWTLAKNQIREFEKNKKTSYNEKVNNQKNIEAVKLCEYAIKNKINENVVVTRSDELKYNIKDNAKSLLLDSVQSFSFFIIIVAVVISGTIVSEEFNKGTIKLLLVRPFKRVQILLAKFIASLIILLISITTVIILQTIIGGICYGFDSYSLPTLVYNFNTNSVENIGTIQYLLISAICLLPKFILLLTLSFTIGTVLVSTPIAIAIPLIGVMGEEIINQLVSSFEKARFLIYFVTPNWDLNIYTFGKLPEIEKITLPFSIIVCMFYFIVMISINIFAFKKKNIKNI